jgi:hypothetical protein
MIRKIDVFNGFVSLVEDFPEWERDQLQMRKKALVLRSRQSRK